MMITLDDYAGPYADHPDWKRHEVQDDAALLVKAVDQILFIAEHEIVLRKNPNTLTYVAGNGNGGFRPQDSPVGAANSAHKRGRAVDIYDPYRELARWCLRNQGRLERYGILAMEDPRWTPTWVHMQTVPVRSGNFSFIPNSSPPLAAALPEQVMA